MRKAEDRKCENMTSQERKAMTALANYICGREVEDWEIDYFDGFLLHLEEYNGCMYVCDYENQDLFTIIDVETMEIIEGQKAISIVYGEC